MAAKKRCQMVTKSGATCRGFALKGSRYCSLHDPRNIKRVNEGRKKGGRIPRAKALIKELKAVKDFDSLFDALNDLMRHIYAGKVSPKQGTTIVQILSGLRTVLVDKAERPGLARQGQYDLSLLTNDELDTLEEIGLALEKRRLERHDTRPALPSPRPTVERREAISSSADDDKGENETELHEPGEVPKALILDVDNVGKADLQVPTPEGPPTVKAVKAGSGDRWNVVRIADNFILSDNLSEKDAKEVARALSSEPPEKPQPPKVIREAKVY
jgi:hypothetical protein